MLIIDTVVGTTQTGPSILVTASGGVRVPALAGVFFDGIASLRNDGFIVTDDRAVQADVEVPGAVLTIANNGRILGEAGIWVGGPEAATSTVRIVNDGLIRGLDEFETHFDGGAVVLRAATARITNGGKIDGDVLLVGETAAIINSGVISGSLVIEASTIGIRNTGRIVDNVVVNEGTLAFTNAAGASVGALQCSFFSGNDRILNAGVIRSVDLGYDDDVYQGYGTGRVLNAVNGGYGNDRLTGGDVFDQLFGGDGDDALAGGGGGDFLDGGFDVDGLFGGAGRDTLLGGAGRDVVAGGTGADTFVLEEPFLEGQIEVDFITDFSSAQRDKLDLSAFDLTGFDDPDLVIVQTLTRTIVVVGDAQFRLKGLVDLDAGDFVF